MLILPITYDLRPPVLPGCERSYGPGLVEVGGTLRAALRRLLSAYGATSLARFPPVRATVPQSPSSSLKDSLARLRSIGLCSIGLCGPRSCQPVRATVPQPIPSVSCRLSRCVFCFGLATTSSPLCVRCVLCTSLLQFAPRDYFRASLPKVPCSKLGIGSSPSILSHTPRPPSWTEIGGLVCGNPPQVPLPFPVVVLLLSSQAPRLARRLGSGLLHVVAISTPL